MTPTRRGKLIGTIRDSAAKRDEIAEWIARQDDLQAEADGSTSPAKSTGSEVADA
jgi:hypothetical protein